jgi:hypothetical protein
MLDLHSAYSWVGSLETRIPPLTPSQEFTHTFALAFFYSGWFEISSACCLTEVRGSSDMQHVDNKLQYICEQVSDSRDQTPVFRHSKNPMRVRVVDA